MLTILFVCWLLAMTFKLAGFAIRVGWGLMKFLLFVVFLPVTILVLLIVGIIQLTIPVLLIIGAATVFHMIFGSIA